MQTHNNPNISYHSATLTKAHTLRIEASILRRSHNTSSISHQYNIMHSLYGKTLLISIARIDLPHYRLRAQLTVTKKKPLPCMHKIRLSIPVCQCCEVSNPSTNMTQLSSLQKQARMRNAGGDVNVSETRCKCCCRNTNARCPSRNACPASRSGRRAIQSPCAAVSFLLRRR